MTFFFSSKFAVKISFKMVEKNKDSSNSYKRQNDLNCYDKSGILCYSYGLLTAYNTIEIVFIIPKICWDQNYVLYSNRISKHVEGLPTGLPSSPFLVEIFICNLTTPLFQ